MSGEEVAPPVWLDRAEQLAWRRLVAVIFTLPSAMDARLQRRSGLTLFDYQVLVTLSEEPSHLLRMGVIAERTSSSLSRLSHVVTKLEAQGWMDREALPGNRRVTMVRLSSAGLAKVEASAPDHVAHIRELVFDQLDDLHVARLSELSSLLLVKLDPDNHFTDTELGTL